MVEQPIARMIYPMTPSKFGFFLIAFCSVVIIILKVMIHYSIGIGTTFFTFLYSMVIVLPVLLTIALLLIFWRFLKNYLYLLVSFVIILILMYIFITPLLTGGV